MRIVTKYIFLLSVVVVKDSLSLLCWRCNVVGGEDECSYRGRPEICHKNQACITELREENKVSILIRSCKQKRACRGMEKDNQITCKKFRRGIQSSICYDCCTKRDFCNALHNDPTVNKSSQDKAKPFITRQLDVTESPEGVLNKQELTESSFITQETLLVLATEVHATVDYKDKKEIDGIHETTRCRSTTSSTHQLIQQSTQQSMQQWIQQSTQQSTEDLSRVKSNLRGGIFIVEPEYFKKSDG